MAGGTGDDSSYGSFSIQTKTLMHLLPMTGVCGPGVLVHFLDWAKFLRPQSP